MTGVLLLAHGSREPEAAVVMEQIAGQVRALLPDWAVETAYLQFGVPSLEEGLALLKGQGADEIRVLPYFLFEGVHVRRLSSILSAFEAAHPETRVRLGRVLGGDERLARILADRAREL